MITGIIDQSIIGINDTLAIACAALIIDIALIVLASFFFRKVAFVVGKTVSADAETGTDLVEIAFAGFPSFLFCFVFGDVVGREFAIGMDIQSHFFLAGIGPIFPDRLNGNRFLDRIRMEKETLQTIQDAKSQQDDKERLQELFHNLIIKQKHECRKKEENARIKMMDTYRYGNEDAQVVLVQLVSDYELRFLQEEYDLIKEKLPERDFLLLGLRIDDWNEELSPWEAPAVFGKDDFGSGANDTLQELIRTLKDPVLKQKDLYLGGYSLAGLFALWAAYQTDLFKGVAAVSPSVWFPGFLDYVKGNEIRTNKIYLSLGDQEHKTRHPVMATVQDNIEALHQYYQQKGCECLLEYNPGNHFRDPHLRMTKGFFWLLRDE